MTSYGNVYFGYWIDKHDVVILGEGVRVRALVAQRSVARVARGFRVTVRRVVHRLAARASNGERAG